MYLYNLTLQGATAITHAVHGNFSGSKQQEIIISRGKILELLKPDPNTGKVHTLMKQEIFGVIRSLMAFRLTGGTKDYIVVGSDAGRIVILEYIAAKNILDKVHQETFGKSGCRRIVPGQYLAIDPKGRAVMIGAIEKQKLVYILNRDAEARLTISSPLEAHKSNTLVYHMVGVDVGFENPMFACLEIDYEDADSDPTGEAAQRTQQTLTFYELDLGLNHVVRKYSEPLDEHANFLITVPGGNDGPSGVLICSENYLTYKNLGDQHDIRCPIPRRRNDLDDPERGMIFVCSATHKTKSMFFFLMQTEQGDIFKVTVETDEDVVTEIKLKYFDTVPVAASMCVLKTGFLFVACEFGNHYLYQIAHLGDEDDEPEFSSAMPLEEGDTFFFAPRSLKNLVLVDELDSLSPIMGCAIQDAGAEESPAIWLACGRGPRSNIRTLKHGLEVAEMAVSELPGCPDAVWTVRRHKDDAYDSYIMVSFVNATLVLSIGETVEEVTDSGFLGTTPTLAVGSVGTDALVQVYAEGIRHVRWDRRVNEWRAPGSKTIAAAALNQRQLVVALHGGELLYFEVDPTGQLNEYTERKKLSSEVSCMALGSVPAGEQRALFLAVGLADNTVRIISLDPQDCLAPRSMQALPAAPASLCVLNMQLHIGLHNGVLLRTTLDPVTGDLADTRTRYLGSRPVKLFKVKVQGGEAVLGVSSRTWLGYQHQGRFHLTPLSYDCLEYAAGFSSEQCTEGIVAIASNTLRILALEKLGTVFNQTSVPLQYTPRRFVINPDTQQLIIAETDHNAYTEESKKQRRMQMAEEMREAAADGTAEEQQLAAEVASAFLNDVLPDNIFSAPKAGAGMWAGQLRVMEANGATAQLLPLEQNEALSSLAIVQFADHSYPCLAVGVARDMLLSPRACVDAAIFLYKIQQSTGKLELIHKTQVDEYVGALAASNGKLLAGVGRMLRLYDIGKRKLLRKCENRHLPNLIADIKTIGQRIYVSDVQESVFCVKHKKRENQLVIFADDTNPRWITSTCLLDYDTIATADKFGNIAILRLPHTVSDDVDEDPTGNKALWDRGLLNGASQKIEVAINFHVGETVSSLQKVTLIPGGSETLLYATLSGSLGVLLPFTSREDHDFFQHLEMHMRSENSPLCGRDHLSFRSYYYPVKNVIDGDLCEQYNSLDPAKQKSIANDLERTPAEVSKKLEDIRTRYAF